jgi:hypothetical protein
MSPSGERRSPAVETCNGGQGENLGMSIVALSTATTLSQGFHHVWYKTDITPWVELIVILGIAAVAGFWWGSMRRAREESRRQRADRDAQTRKASEARQMDEIDI